ncbi:MAG TPA: sigma 54-interacting transcriptional regulator, partial [Pirellulales bacterium]
MTRLRGLAADVLRLFDHSPTPIYVLDDRRQIIYCNPACARWVGRRSSELTNLQCEFHSPGDERDPAAADLCPAPEAFSGRFSSGLIGISTADGQMRYRRGQFIPLADGQDESAPVLVVLEANDCEPPRPVLGSDAHLHEQVRRFQSEMGRRFQAECLIGDSPAIVQARRQIELAAGSRASVLCLGEVGTGKKQVARAIHYSQLQPGAFVPLACGALEPNLLRGTLRSVSTRRSADAAFKATLLLEDVDQLCPEAHADVWQFFEFRPDQVRVIATSSTTQAELEAALANPPLVCALGTVTIRLPALRDRPEDLPLLAQVFLERENVDNPKQLGTFTPEALDVLAAHAWPGNFDELAQV